MVEQYGCNVFSFDPIVEADIFEKIRRSNATLASSVEIRVNEKWKFYKLGITGFVDSAATDLSRLAMGNSLLLNNVLKLTNMEKKVIDIFKMDVEGNENAVLFGLDMAFACQYIKQIMFETHQSVKFHVIQRLEECFLLFHRDTRFFQLGHEHPLNGPLTEFTDPDGFKLELKQFKNELHLAEFMFINGEFYFLNRNFLKDFYEKSYE
jgi:hypothetical protein